MTNGNLKCAFCRQEPHVSVLNKHNRELRAVQNIPKEWDYNWHYAWCAKCDVIKQCIERNCARETEWDPSRIQNFVCEECSIVPEASIVPKECPGCKVATIKSHGCDHMTCPCGVHWCFECGGEFSYNNIYDHMSSEHGGIGFIAGYDDADEYYLDEE